MRYTFSKKDKLTKKEHFDALYISTRGVKSFPFSLRYVQTELDEAGVSRQVAIVAPKRGLKHAVDRNRLKRQMRELYRLHKDKIMDSGVQEIWSLRYLGNRLNDYAFLEKGYLNLIEVYNEQRKKELDSTGSE
ncbi:MAG: ribonuclease P protein component [Schleiferiaceae bacterium]|jgi:ribonuclease P protein component|nr:ribonuclease P protein component [Schleiferiaceae bacterium]